MTGNDINLDAIEAAYRGRGHDHSVNKLIRALRAFSAANGHNAPCLMCGKPCSALAGNPALWPLRLGNDGWHHTGCVVSVIREFEKRQAERIAAMERDDRSPT